MIIGAYASSPCQTAWDAAAEGRFYDGLQDIEGADGFEIPFTGALHPHDEAWLLRRLPRTWRHAVTCIPGTMPRMAADPHFGLASDDPAGRAAALAFALQARAAVARLNDHVGSPAVRAVELHSAPAVGPAGVRSSVASLAASLAELAAQDWQGAALVIEHCDAFTTAHTPHKGFLSFEQELAAIAAAAPAGGTSLGMSINWGRSVLETRRPETACDHIAVAEAAGRLTGLVFSGCSAVADQPYGAWQDNHMPHAPAPGLEYAAEGSLMTEAAIAACLAIGRPAYLGVKIGARPADTAIARRIGLNRDLVALVQRNRTLR